jgi:Flp pilus assembly protein TadG
MAEFALVLPMLLVLILGITQLGFLFATQIGLANAAREGARYGATVPSTDGSSAVAVQNHLWNSGTGTGALDQALGFTPDALSSRTVSYCKYQTPNANWHVRLRATVIYNHPLFVPIIGAILDPLDSPSTPGAFQVTVTEEMRVENATNLTTAPSVGDC